MAGDLQGECLSHSGGIMTSQEVQEALIEGKTYVQLTEEWKEQLRKEAQKQ